MSQETKREGNDQIPRKVEERGLPKRKGEVLEEYGRKKRDG